MVRVLKDVRVRDVKEDVEDKGLVCCSPILLRWFLPENTDHDSRQSKQISRE